MYLVQNISNAIQKFPDISGKNVDWAINQKGLIGDEYLKEVQKFPAIWTVIAGPDFAAISIALGGASSLQFKDEGINLGGTDASNINFIGNGIKATRAGAQINVNVPGKTLTSFVGTHKPKGSQTQIFEAYNPHHGVTKLRAPAHFNSLQIGIISREAKDSSRWKVAVACTDEPGYGSVANQTQPRKGGTTYNVNSATAQDNGWKVATWDGGQSTESGVLYRSSDFQQPASTLPADTVITDVIWTDPIILDSFNPNTPDPVTGELLPWLLVKTDMLGSGSSSAHTNAVLASYVAGQDYTVKVGLPAGDIVADPTLVAAAVVDPVATVTYTPTFYIKYNFKVPVRSFAAVGDSKTEGYKWIADALKAKTTAAKPFIHANFGMSSNRPQQYEYNALNQIVAGANVTDMIYPSHSVNDGFSEAYPMNQHRRRILNMIDFCDAHGINLWIWTDYAFYNNGFPVSGATDNLCNWVRQLAADGRIYKLIDIRAGWNNSTVVGAGGMLDPDNTHPNSTNGIPYMTSVLTAALASE